MNHDAAILDIGSGKVTVLVGERGVNHTIRIRGMGTCEYAGFADGEMFDPAGFAAAVTKAVADAEAAAVEKITRLYVGVPGEFTSVVCKDTGIVFGHRRKVSEEDRFALMDSGDDFDQSAYEVINIQPVYYSLDNERRVLEPVGERSSKLGGLLSYVVCDVSFTRFIRETLAAIGIESVEIVSSVLAEALLLFDEEQRDNTAVLADVGYLTTTVAVIRGDALLSLGSFSMGGGHISGDLSNVLGIPFSDAETLKRKVVLSVIADENDIYEIEGKKGIRTVSASLVNEIVLHRVGLIAKGIEKCLKLSPYDYPDYVPYSLTGGGIAFMRGAKDILMQSLGRNVEIAAPRMPQVNKPDLSAPWGLMDMAVTSEGAEKVGFFARLFRK